MSTSEDDLRTDVIDPEGAFSQGKGERIFFGGCGNWRLTL